MIDPAGDLAGFSSNAPAMLGGPLARGGRADAAVGDGAHAQIRAMLQASGGKRPLRVDDGVFRSAVDRNFEALAHASHGHDIVEFIPREAEDVLEPPPMTAAPDGLFHHCVARAERVRALTGYDRVMVYRFHQDFTGEVIAEFRRPDMAPYLGLRYPASDIPSQARALYLENPLRLIPNIYGSTASLSSSIRIDLSIAALRAVSPYHIEYLHNMQVGATLTLSIIVEGRLWGLIACHHAGERRLSLARQAAALAEAEALGETLAALEIEEASNTVQALRALQARWRDRLSGERVAEPLLSGMDSIVTDLHADGGAIVCGDACLGVGATPDVDWLVSVAHGPGIAVCPAVVATERLSELEGLPPTAASAGALIARIESDPPTTLFVFRRAHVQEVHWGGDPRAAVITSPTDGRPSPRQSFALWRQLVQDRARPWTPLEQEVFNACVERLTSHLAGDVEAAASLRHELAEVSTAYSHVADSHRLLADALPEGVAVLLWAVGDSGSRLLYANRAFTQLFGLDLSDIVDRKADHLLERTRLGREILEPSDSDDQEHDIWSPALGVRRVRARREALVRYRGPAGDCEIQSLLLSDTTGASRTHDALLSAVRQAETAESARGALLRNMSHELRTPLNAILGYSDMIAQELLGPLGDEAYRRAAEEIRTSADHLLALINDTLDAARLREGKVRITPARHDLGAIVLSATRLVQTLASSKQIALGVELPDAPLFGKVDELALRQVFINLVNNAIKFTMDGGSVDVRLVRDETGAAVVSVQDTGIGIPRHEINRLFIPFSQVDSTLSRGTSGTGLGLSIVKELVQLHGGKIEVVSREGVGSTFSVRLPTWRMEAA